MGRHEGHELDHALGGDGVESREAVAEVLAAGEAEHVRHDVAHGRDHGDAAVLDLRGGVLVHLRVRVAEAQRVELGVHRPRHADDAALNRALGHASGTGRRTQDGNARGREGRGARGGTGLRLRDALLERQGRGLAAQVALGHEGAGGREQRRAGGHRHRNARLKGIEKGDV